MNQDNKDEMLPEYDMRGAVRGKFLAHALRWSGITTAAGSISPNTLSTGEPTTPKLVIPALSIHVSLHSQRMAAEVLTPGA